LSTWGPDGLTYHSYDIRGLEQPTEMAHSGYKKSPKGEDKEYPKKKDPKFDKKRKGEGRRKGPKNLKHMMDC
jgi:hypothetical protein